MLEIQGVTKKFKQHTAVDRLSLIVPDGEVFALLGPNGAGKTTTLNLILGFEKADQGTILVDGFDVSKDLMEVRKRLAFIPENVQLYPHLSGKENLAYFSQLAGANYSQDQLKELLLEAGLQEKAHHSPISTYSKGMRQKVGVAIAYSKKAKLLLLDEPASGLDPLSSAELSQLVRKVAAQGATVLMVSHDLFRVKETADRVGIFKNGELKQIVKASEVTANDLELIYQGIVE
ncbi:MAG: ABC transporter ATP-binding protein [Cytophagales bacterium]|uniref:ABC transporter ATP-binding protein n=1 Tax=Algoriphagus taiwanensis TaxID=1445656 RepID=A0ABQ6PYL5_9BACT|nr:MAG: ABC transporter ATP-binding protein [Cytophagales bacterium]GMQ33024.1 ABC transporter ATP-binding protein [Algoriphagus taiwanensis]